MAIYRDGKRVATNTPTRELTTAQYNSLTPAEKSNGTFYYITDAEDETYQKLNKLADVVGEEADLPAGMTIADCIADLYGKLGGLEFSLNNQNALQATYVGNKPAVGPTNIDTANMTDEEKVDHLIEVLGDESEITSLGYRTVVGSILELYRRLAGGEISFNPVLNPQGVMTTVSVSYEAK